MKGATVEVPEVVVSRLPQYVRALREVLRAQTEVISSQGLGELLHITPAQIRKDLSYFGRFGKQGRGYNVRNLITELQQILGLDRQWNVLVVGVGRLGRAIIGYPGFTPEGFQIVEIFDADPRQVNQRIGGLVVRSMDEMGPIVKEKHIRIAIVAVPAEDAHEVVEQLIAVGIKSIMNYTPTTPYAPDDVKIRSIDPVLILQSMTYYLRGHG